jgi:hypothetical protein
MSNNNIRLRCEKKDDPRWQSNETSPKTRHASNWVASKGDTSYKHASIGNGLYSSLPIQQGIDRNGLYKPVTDRFNICNGFYLTSVTKNLCNGRLRSLLPEVHIGNGRCGGQPRGLPGALIGNRRQTTTVTDVGGCNGR